MYVHMMRNEWYIFAGFESVKIFVSRVNDGICDCCDGADEWGQAGARCENRCRKFAKEVLDRQRQALDRLKAGVAKRADYENDARSALLVKRLQVKHKRQQVESGREALERLKVEVRQERRSRTLRKPDLLLPQFVDVFDALTTHEEQMLESVHRYLDKAGGECGEGDALVAAGGGDGWPNNKLLAAHLQTELGRRREVALGLPFTRALIGRGVAAYQLKRGCSTWSALSGNEDALGDVATPHAWLQTHKKTVVDASASTLPHARPPDASPPDASPPLVLPGDEESEMQEERSVDVVSGPMSMGGSTGRTGTYVSMLYHVVMSLWYDRLPEQSIDKLAELGKAEREVKAASEAIAALEADLARDYGPRAAYYPLYPTCFSAPFHGYTYNVCPFDKVEQKKDGRTIVLGSFVGWRRKRKGTAVASSYEVSQAVDFNVLTPSPGEQGAPREKGAARAGNAQGEDMEEGHEIIQAFGNGEACAWPAGRRSALVLFHCANAESVVSVQEVETCKYVLQFSTAAACHKGEVEAASEKLRAGEAILAAMPHA